MVAAIIVAAIALLLGLFAEGDDEWVAGSSTVQPSLEVTVAPPPGVQQPARETWEELLTRLEAAVESAPNDVNLQRKLALAYYNLARYEEAAAIYERLLASGEDAVLRSRLGNTLRDMGDAAGAEAAYRRAIEDDPTLAPPYLDLAELLWRQSRDDEALAVLDQGLAAVPEENRARLEEGRAAIIAGADSD